MPPRFGGNLTGINLLNRNATNPTATQSLLDGVRAEVHSWDGSGCVDSFTQRTQQDSSLAEFGDGVVVPGDFGDGAAEAVEAVDRGGYDGVTDTGVVERRGEPGPGGCR